MGHINETLEKFVHREFKLEFRLIFNSMDGKYTTSFFFLMKHVYAAFSLAFSSLLDVSAY